MEESSKCLFPDCKQTKDLTTAGLQRIRTIIAASKARGDNIHLYQENELLQNPELTVSCHRDCVATYTSKHHISRSLQKRVISPDIGHIVNLQSGEEGQKNPIFSSKSTVFSAVKSA